MRRIATLVLIGLAVFSTVYLVLPEPALQGEAAPGAAEPSPRTVEARQSEPAAATLAATEPAGEPPREIVDRAVRDVTPAGVTPGPKVTGPLARIPTPPRPEKPKPPTPARHERLFRPVIAAPGAIQIASGTIKLADIEAPGPEEQCGAGWPCGRMARTALRQFIRGRAIECEVPAGAERIPEVATCRVGGRDIADWFVGQGWAKAGSERYRAAEDKAREARLGLWGDGARKPAGAVREAAVQPGAGLAAAASSPDSARAISDRVSAMP